MTVTYLQPAGYAGVVPQAALRFKLKFRFFCVFITGRTQQYSQPSQIPGTLAARHDDQPKTQLIDTKPTDNKMPIVSILTFFASFILIVFVGLYIFLTFYNKRTRTVIDKFIGQSSGLRPTVFQRIKLRYSETSGLKTYIYPNNRCDLYLFDNYLAIVRRQDFIFKVFFAPILLTSDMATTKNIFNYLDTYKPDSITFKQIVKGEIDIKLTDPTYKHYAKDITLKGLTNEQTIQLEKIKTWC